jgi:hypothetical protein
MKEKTSFFGVFDGHRNSYSSDFLQRNLAKAIVNHPSFYTKRSEAIKEGKHSNNYFSILIKSFLSLNFCFIFS